MKVKNEKIINLDQIKFFIVCIYLVVYYIFIDSEKYYYSKLILIVFLGLETLHIIRTRKIAYSLPIVVLYGFDVFCLLSSTWAINLTLAVKRAKTLLIFTTFLLFLFNFFSSVENGSEILLKILMISGFVFSIYVILYYGVGEYFKKLVNGERVGGEINNVNTIGLETSISVLIAIYFILYKRKIRYLFYAITPTIVSLGTGSKKVIILIVLGTILLFLFNKDKIIKLKQLLRKIFFLIILIVGFVFLMKLPIFATIFKRFQSITNFLSKQGAVDGSTILRSRMIQVGFKQFLQKPFLGIGINNSGYLTITIARNFFAYLHNNYVELLASVGIIGFVLYYFTYFYIIYYCVKYFYANDLVKIVLIIMIVNMVLEYGMVTYADQSTYIYILLGLTVIRKIKKEKI